MKVTEEEAYDEIEERLGILALRLGYKPKGMELESVYIDENMGEAQMEFYNAEKYLIIYENKQTNKAVFDVQLDGEIVDTVKMFQSEEGVEILEINRSKNEVFYAVQFEWGNAYYCVTSSLYLENFKEIVRGIFF